MEKSDGLTYLAQHAPNEAALMIEDASTVYDDEFAELQKYSKALKVPVDNAPDAAHLAPLHGCVSCPPLIRVRSSSPRRV